jgi:hypothetical protein
VSLLGQCSAKDGDSKAFLTAASQKGSLAVLFCERCKASLTATSQKGSSAVLFNRRAMAVIAIVSLSLPPWLLVHRTTGSHGVLKFSDKNWSLSLTAVVRNRFLYRFDLECLDYTLFTTGSDNWGAIVSTVSCCVVMSESQGGVDLSVVGPSLVDCKRVFYRPKSHSLLDGTGTQWMLCVVSGKDDVGLDYPYILTIRQDPLSSFVKSLKQKVTWLNVTLELCVCSRICTCVRLVFISRFDVHNFQAVKDVYSFSDPKCYVLGVCLVSPSNDWPAHEFQVIIIILLMFFV